MDGLRSGVYSARDILFLLNYVSTRRHALHDSSLLPNLFLNINAFASLSKATKAFEASSDLVSLLNTLQECIDNFSLESNLLVEDEQEKSQTRANSDSELGNKHEFMILGNEHRECLRIIAIEFVGYTLPGVPSHVEEAICEWRTPNGEVETASCPLSFLKKKYPNLILEKSPSRAQTPAKYLIHSFRAINLSSDRIFVTVQWLFYSSSFNEKVDIASLHKDVPYTLADYLGSLGTLVLTEPIEIVEKQQVLSLYTKLKRRYEFLKAIEVVSILGCCLNCHTGVILHIINNYAATGSHISSYQDDAMI